MFGRNVRKSKNNFFNYPRNSFFYKMYLWFAGRHWWILSLTAILLFILEAYDYMRHRGDITHVFELVVYIGLLFVVGVLIDLLITEIRIQAQTKEILDFKHKLSLEFSGLHDWDGLVNHIARFPGRIAPITQTCLLVSDPISGQFNPAAEWSGNEPQEADFCTIETCQDCLAMDPHAEETFYPCTPDSTIPNLTHPLQKYCLSFRYGGRVVAIMPFLLEKGESLTENQKELFENIGDEIALALQDGLDRQAFYEMRSSEAALAERREVSHYLHDHLGQSLGYLHIKMDQMIMEKKNLSMDTLFMDLEQMRKAVNESYEIVRGILETIHSETAPSLTNLLMEHAKKIAQRAHLQIDFKTKGKPSSLDPEVQRAVFYAFEESLSNAEKHSRANKIEILADWGLDELALTISDDGIGFNPQTVDTEQHFGMEILNERMTKVNGRITLTTSENSGTVVNINVPRDTDGKDGRSQ